MAKTAKSKYEELEPEVDVSQPVHSTATRPTHEQIAERAYQLYEERGGEDGHALEDWLKAELELNEADSRNIVVK
jgi:Protein of unknown function (DUF2934)